MFFHPVKLIFDFFNIKCQHLIILSFFLFNISHVFFEVLVTFVLWSTNSSQSSSPRVDVCDIFEEIPSRRD